MTPNDRAGERRAQLLLFMVVIIWATNYPLAKFTIARMDVFVFNALRFLVATLVLVAICFRQRQWASVARGDRRHILRAGIVANVLYQSAFIVGLGLTTAGNSAVLMATSPLWTIVLHARLHRETIPSGMWWGLMLSLVGVVLIIIGSGRKVAFGGNEIVGDVVCLAAAFLWAFNTNLQKPLLQQYAPLPLAAMMVGVGAVGLSILALPAALSMDWAALSWEYWAATVVSGALSIGVSNAVWSYGVQRLGPGRTGSFSNLVPVIALIVSYLSLDEQIYVSQLLGSAITIAGVWLARR